MSRRVLLAVALVLLGGVGLFVGTMRGEAAAVLKQATRICLECVGIG